MRDQETKLIENQLGEGWRIYEAFCPSHLAINQVTKEFKFIELLRPGKRIRKQKALSFQRLKEAGIQVEIELFTSKESETPRLKSLPFSNLDIRIVETEKLAVIKAKKELKKVLKKNKIIDKVYMTDPKEKNLMRQPSTEESLLQHKTVDFNKLTRFLDKSEKEELKEFETIFNNLTKTAEKAATEPDNEAVKESVDETPKEPIKEELV